MPDDEHNEIIEFIESSLALHEADKDNEEFINQDKQISRR